VAALLRDVHLRRAAIDCVVAMTKLHEIHPLPMAHCARVRADATVRTTL
jgi:hypothetical protein